MTLFTRSFINKGKTKRSEVTALLVSLLSSVVFLTWFVSWFEPARPEVRVVISSGVAPARLAEVKQPQEPKDPNERFRAVPLDFTWIDFANWSYGPYKFGAKKFTLTLADREHEIPFPGGGAERFYLRDVFYTDITGDANAEAVVILSHVTCGGSCDGSSVLLFVYEYRKGSIRKIWEYETGSMAYGCGLKSLTISEKQVVVEMFGQCWKPASSFEGSGKFLVRDLTRAVFNFNGRRFIKASTEVTAAPARDVRNYTPEIHIKVPAD